MNEIVDLLQVERKVFTDISTIGVLSVKRQKLCWTLEDTCRMVKIDKVTAIPAGRYRCVLSEWNKYGIIVIELLDVPFFKYIKIHPLNTVDQNDGCISIGYDAIGFKRIQNSGAASRDLMGHVKNDMETNMSYCTVSGGYNADEWEQSHDDKRSNRRQFY